jgi:hypothetical protein
MRVTITVRRVGYIRTFTALGAAGTFSFGLFTNPWAWFLPRKLNGASMIIGE